MATWKKVIVSGSQAHLQGITASNLTNNTAAPTAQIVGYNPTTGVLSYFNTSSIVTTNAFVQGGNSFGTTALLGTNDNQNLQFETNGSVRMTISSSGNIGIGGASTVSGSEFGLSIYNNTSTPHNLIVGTTDQTATPPNTASVIIGGLTAHLDLYNPSGTVAADEIIGAIRFRNNDAPSLGITKAQIAGYATDTSPDGYLVFSTQQNAAPSGLTERMRITNTGNVGIGTTTPTNTLQVGGTGISTTNLTASALPTLAQVQVLGIDSSGNITKFSTSSIALPTTIDGVGVGQRLTMWSDTNTITTSSIVMTTEANPRFIVGYTDTGSSPVFAGRLNVSGSGGNEGIVVGSRVSTDVNSYGTYVFSDTEGPKIGFGSYTTGATTTPLSASWAQIGVYNQALRFEAFTTGSHVLSGGILFSYSGSNRPDLKISASNGATLVGINTATPTNTLQVGGGITAVNITASGGATVGGNVVVTGDLGVNSTGIGITAVNITASNNLLVSNNLIVNGNTTTTTLGAMAITTVGNVVVGGDLTVNGETTIINTTNLSIEDKFIVLGRSSGSQAPASEGGIIVEGAAGSGSAFVFNSGSGGANGLANRWGVALGVGTASMNVTPIDFMVTVSSSGVSPTDSNAPTFGSSSFGFGNMHINTNDGEIWIYV